MSFSMDGPDELRAAVARQGWFHSIGLGLGIVVIHAHRAWRGKGSRRETRSIRLMPDAGLSGTMTCVNTFTNILDKLRGPIQSVPTSADLVIRHARPDEADALATLAQLDSSRAPRGDVLVADVKGELWAAVSVDDGHAVANPFRPSGELTFHLLERARELHGGRRDRTWRPRGSWPRHARIEAA